MRRARPTLPNHEPGRLPTKSPPIGVCDVEGRVMSPPNFTTTTPMSSTNDVGYFCFHIW